MPSDTLPARLAALGFWIDLARSVEDCPTCEDSIGLDAHGDVCENCNGQGSVIVPDPDADHDAALRHLAALLAGQRVPLPEGWRFLGSPSPVAVALAGPDGERLWLWLGRWDVEASGVVSPRVLAAARLATGDPDQARIAAHEAGLGDDRVGRNPTRPGRAPRREGVTMSADAFQIAYDPSPDGPLWCRMRAIALGPDASPDVTHEEWERWAALALAVADGGPLSRDVVRKAGREAIGLAFEAGCGPLGDSWLTTSYDAGDLAFSMEEASTLAG